MAFIEDTSMFFADFGVDAVVDGVNVVGIFDKAYQESFGIVSGDNPILVVSSNVAAAEGDSVTINATSYTVAGVQPDGTGITILQLEAA